MIKFEATFTTTEGRYVGQDYDTAEEATKAVQANGRGFVVKAIGHDNLPHCLPAIVWRTTAMWTLDHEHGWREHSLHDGYGSVIGQSTPN